MLLSRDSFIRSSIYTIGHIIIATICNVYITGAVVKLAFTDALIEPLINMLWFYVLDIIYTSVLPKINNKK